VNSVDSREVLRIPSSAGADGRGRILVVAPQPFFEDRGTPIAVRHLIESLLGSGFSVDLLTYPVGSDIELGDVRITRCRNLLGLRSVPVGFSWRKVILDLSMIVRLRQMLQRVDYCAVHAVEEMAFAAVALAARHHLPVVYDMHSSLPDQLRSNPIFRTAPMQHLLLRAERWLIEQADAVACSAGLASYVRRINAQAPMMEWRFPGTPSAERSDIRGSWLRELGLRPDARVVLYTGTFATYQGLRVLIDAMAKVVAFDPAAVLVLVGATPGRGSPESDNAARLAASGHLVVVPRQPQALIPALLATAEILVSPRLYGDNVPLKIFEYLRAGKPIVATDTTGHRSVLSDDVAVFVERDAGSMAAGIIRLLANPGLARTLAGRAKDYEVAEELFPALVSRLYDRLLSGRAATSPAVDAAGTERTDVGGVTRAP
jgi:glycosyltransferase involved in cell wall biosynthesis